MRLPLATLPSLALLLAACATPKHFLEKDAGPVPTRLTVHLDPVQVGNPDDLLEDLQLDANGLRDWMKPLLEARLRKFTGIDTLVWDDSLATVPWTARVGRTTIEVSRPADSAADGWTLVLGNGRTDRGRQPGLVVDGIQTTKRTLDLVLTYTLVERRTGRVLAFGSSRRSSPYTFSMGRGEWEDVASSAGWDIGRRLPRTSAGKAVEERTWDPEQRKLTAPNRRP